MSRRLIVFEILLKVMSKMALITIEVTKEVETLFGLRNSKALTTITNHEI